MQAGKLHADRFIVAVLECPVDVADSMGLESAANAIDCMFLTSVRAVDEIAQIWGDCDGTSAVKYDEMIVRRDRREARVRACF